MEDRAEYVFGFFLIFFFDREKAFASVCLKLVSWMRRKLTWGQMAGRYGPKNPKTQEPEGAG